MQPVQANRSPFSTRDLVQPILTVVLPVSMGCLRVGATLFDVKRQGDLN